MTTLIETIVAMYLIAIMVLGLDALHVSAIRQAKAAYFSTIAIEQLEVIAERLIAKTGESIFDKQLKWNNQNSAALPQGLGSVASNGPGMQTAISWGGHSASNCQENRTGQSGCLRFSIHEESEFRHNFA